MGVVLSYAIADVSVVLHCEKIVVGNTPGVRVPSKIPALCATSAEAGRLRATVRRID